MTAQEIADQLKPETVKKLSNDKANIEKALNKKVTWDQFFNGMLKELSQR